MQLGVLTAQPLGHMDRSDAFDFLETLGVDAVELGAGGLIGSDHIDRGHLLDNDDAECFEEVERVRTIHVPERLGCEYAELHTNDVWIECAK